MNKYIPLLAAVTFGSIIVACSEQKTSPNTVIDTMNVNAANVLTYPVTKKGDVTDEYFGAKVSDPYRWLDMTEVNKPLAGLKRKTK
jgi:prolyl oligopeptidase